MIALFTPPLIGLCVIALAITRDVLYPRLRDEEGQ
jgi:hypothetical protein